MDILTQLVTLLGHVVLGVLDLLRGLLGGL